MTNRCIYCPAETTGDEGRAHAVPEALVSTELTLPEGACCDDCNNYLGKLDSAMVSHPIISMYVQFLGLPGKGGEPRRELGNVQRDLEGRYIAIPIEEPEAYTDRNGRRGWHLRPRIAPTYDSVEFARALHYLALNGLAVVHGAEAALEEKYDAVRDFIRRPARGERWPYVTWSPGLNPVEEEIEIVTVPDSPGHVVLIQLFNMRYVVDLLQTGKLEDFAASELPDDAHFGFPDPESTPVSEREYRARIWLDEEAARETWREEGV